MNHDTGIYCIAVLAGAWRWFWARSRGNSERFKVEMDENTLYVHYTFNSECNDFFFMIYLAYDEHIYCSILIPFPLHPVLTS